MNTEIKANQPIYLGILSFLFLFAYVLISYLNTIYNNNLIELFSNLPFLISIIISILGLSHVGKVFKNGNRLKGFVAILLNMCPFLFIFIAFIISGADIYSALFY